MTDEGLALWLRRREPVVGSRWTPWASGPATYTADQLEAAVADYVAWRNAQQEADEANPEVQTTSPVAATVVDGQPLVAWAAPGGGEDSPLEVWDVRLGPRPEG